METGAGSLNTAGDRKKRVLIVDDDPVMLRSVRILLEERFEAVLSTSGAKAVPIIEKKRPEVILLDYEMPECDGKQTLALIREREDMKEIPVIFLTGLGDPEHLKSLASLTPFGYIIKPAGKEDLIEAIERALAGRAAG